MNKDTPTSIPRDSEKSYAWIRRNGVTFFQGKRYDKKIKWCDCCGYPVIADMPLYLWSSYYENKPLVALCNFCDVQALRNVQEIMEKLRTMLRDSESDRNV